MAEWFKVGDRVSWNWKAGRVSGTIIRVHMRDFDCTGHTHHANRNLATIRNQEQQNRSHRPA